MKEHLRANLRSLLPPGARSWLHSGGPSGDGTKTTDPFGVFLTPAAFAINKARQDHLASLELDLAGKRVLEVGAGIGLHSGFFESIGCEILSTDGNAENVAEMRRRYPRRQVAVLDLEDRFPPDLGSFDVVYCYGVLYHLADPANALNEMRRVCTGKILLETAVALGKYPECHLLQDPPSHNQAVRGLGCRPTRAWVLKVLRETFGFSYTTATQPDYPDFQTDWRVVETRMLYRAIFVGSTSPLDHARLTSTLPEVQPRVVGI